MQSLFLGHGSPATAFTENRYQQCWQEYGKSISRPKSIVVLSAHWLTRGLMITGQSQLDTIYDFHGFPDEYYRFVYPAKGDLELASQIKSNMPMAILDPSRGLDHGAWTLLKHLFPEADIPVIQLSVNIDWSLTEHVLFARQLNELLSDEVMFLGSGNVVHNLQRRKGDEDAEPYCWAAAFEEQVKKSVLEQNLDRLIELPSDLKSGGPYSVPSLEHYLPAVYVAAMAKEGRRPEVLLEGLNYGSISMFSFMN